MFVCLLGGRGLEYFLAMEDMNLSAIRTIRVLRPLRAINRIPSEYFVWRSASAGREGIQVTVHFFLISLSRLKRTEIVE